jgi:hypothetical protein
VGGVGVGDEVGGVRREQRPGQWRK